MHVEVTAKVNVILDLPSYTCFAHKSKQIKIFESSIINTKHALCHFCIAAILKTVQNDGSEVVEFSIKIIASSLLMTRTT